MKKLVLLAALFITAFFLQSFTPVQNVTEPTKISINSDNPNGAPYIHHVRYEKDGTIVVYIWCDHMCEVKVTPTRQIEGYLTEAAKYMSLIEEESGGYYSGKVKFHCSDGSVGSACRTYDFNVTETRAL